MKTAQLPSSADPRRPAASRHARLITRLLPGWESGASLRPSAALLATCAVLALGSTGWSAATGQAAHGAGEKAAMTNESGTWIAERERGNDNLWVQLQRRGQEGIWVPVPPGEPVGITPGQEIRFELRRAAGTFSMLGTFNGTGPGAKGSGTYTFQLDPQFAQDMEALGYRLPSGEALVDLAIRDVSPAFIRDLQSLGYREVPLSRLTELRAKDVSPQMIRELAEAGYSNLPLSRLLEFRMYDVSLAFVRELAALGYKNLSTQQLVDFRIQDVTPKLIRELSELGYPNLSADRLIELRVQGVDPAFIRKMRQESGRLLPITELIDRKMAQTAAGARR